MKNELSSELFERARKLMPGGVNSPVRAFGSVGGSPYFVSRAEGAHIWDVDGNKFVDFVQSYGPTILGHAHPKVVEAVQAAAADGFSYGAPTLREVELAEEVSGRVPGCEMLRLVSSGTEANMSAVRLARGATGRSKIVKFAGCYHGHSDSLFAAAGGDSGNEPPPSSGIPVGAVADTVEFPYNKLPEIDSDTAAVIVEPVAANMGLIEPAEGFLSGLRQACDKAGALLIYDEVITGFRLARGGGAEYFGVQPDIWCFGKVIGGGLPIGAFGGRSEIMEHLAPLGGVYQGGTLSGNPLATAAALATLQVLTPESYKELTDIANSFRQSLKGSLENAGVSCIVPQVGSLLGIFFTDSMPDNLDDAAAAAYNGVYPKFFHAALNEGLAFAPGPAEIIFVSLSHNEEVMSEVAAAFERVAEKMG